MRPYIKLYIENLAAITRLSPTAKNVLLGMVHYLEEDNTVDLSIHKRHTLLELLGIKKQTFANGLGELQTKQVITKITYGYYAIDPMYLTKPEHDTEPEHR